MKSEGESHKLIQGRLKFKFKTLMTSKQREHELLFMKRIKTRFQFIYLFAFISNKIIKVGQFTVHLWACYKNTK